MDHEKIDEQQGGNGNSNSSKDNENEKRSGMQEDEIRFGGIAIEKRTLLLTAGGAVGALAALGIGKIFGRVRPAAVGTVKEGIAFKEWIAGKLEKAREDIEDVIAEAAFSYQKERAAASDAIKRQEELMEKLEKIIESKTAGVQHEQKEQA